MVGLVGVLIAQTVAILLVCLGVYFRHREAQRAAQLDRLNQQLGRLYGPLYSLYETGEAHWHGFLGTFSNDTTTDNPRFRQFFPKNRAFPRPDDDKLAAYRLWTRTVFLPTNVAMAQIIANNADLLVGDVMPPCLSDFCVHVAGFKPLVAQWDRKEARGELISYDEHLVQFAYPTEFPYYVRNAFEVLKKRQSEFLMNLQRATFDQDGINREITRAVERGVQQHKRALDSLEAPRA